MWKEIASIRKVKIIYNRPILTARNVITANTHCSFQANLQPNSKTGNGFYFHFSPNFLLHDKLFFERQKWVINKFSWRLFSIQKMTSKRIHVLHCSKRGSLLAQTLILKNVLYLMTFFFTRPQLTWVLEIGSCIEIWGSHILSIL